MLTTVSRKFAGGCMMLMKKEKEQLLFLGTAFLVHHRGYLLTAAHNFTEKDELVAVPPYSNIDFIPLTTERVSSLPVEPAQTDIEHDVALLRFKEKMEISAPAHIIGKPDELSDGEYLMAMGFSFAHYRVHALITMQAILSAKLLSVNETRLLLIDTMVRDGDAGGPLISVEDERVVGILLGRFDPAEITNRAPPSNVSYSTDVSYAVSIEYGKELIRQEGLTVI